MKAPVTPMTAEVVCPHVFEFIPETRNKDMPNVVQNHTLEPLP